MMNKEEIEYCLEEFRNNKRAYMFKNGLIVSFYKVFEQLDDLQQRIDKAIQIMYDKATFNLDDKYGKVFLEVLDILGGDVDDE